MMAIGQILKLLMVLMLTTVAFAADVPTAQVDRTILNEGETFTLHLTGDAEPDLEVLKHDFQILGTSKNSQIKFINGKMSSSSQRIVTLSPKKTGSLVIPPISFDGQMTNSIIIVVRPARTQSDIGGNKSIFLEVSADLSKSYVQQQIIYTVKLFSAIEMIEASLSPPAINDAVVERVGKDVTYQTMIDGRRYQVTERKYALFPQKSGLFVIPPTLFNGNLVDSRQVSADPFSRFFQQARTRPMQLKSNEINIDVAPRPRSISGDGWIPASELRMTEEWSPRTPEFRVGDPITRTIRIVVNGLTAAQIPALAVDNVASINFYSDQPLVETHNGDNTLIGIREEKVALVPKVEGKFLLPEIRIPWWSTIENAEKFAVIPARSISVLPAVVQAAKANAETRILQPSASTIEASSQHVVNTTYLSTYWLWLAVFFGVAWLLTLLLLLKIRLQRQKDVGIENKTVDRRCESLKGILREIKMACIANDAAKARSKILIWAAIIWPDKNIKGLDDVSKKLNNDVLVEKFADLNRILYAKQTKNWDGDRFWNSVSADLKIPHEQVRDVGGLPALYPIIKESGPYGR